MAEGDLMPQDITAADLARPAQSLPEPSTVGQINEFMARAEGLFKEGKEFLANLAGISTNPALKKFAKEKLGLNSPALPDSSMQGKPPAPPQVDLEVQFNAMLKALEDFKTMKGDMLLSALITWLQENKLVVMAGMAQQVKG
jgi:hypothetical protein